MIFNRINFVFYISCTFIYFGNLIFTIYRFV
nr:MAG TPA_asm: hypothetical protein [Bacteriophage sp.]